MALDQSALLELTDALRSADGGEVMRRLLLTMLQALIDAEATAHIGAGPHERAEVRTFDPAAGAIHRSRWAAFEPALRDRRRAASAERYTEGSF